MRVLITGVLGFVGSHLAVSLSEKHDVSGIDIAMLPKSYLFKVPDINVNVFIGDIVNYDFVRIIISQYEPDIILHCAAVSVVRHGERCPDLTLKVNALGTLNVLMAAGEFNVAKVVHISTDKVYGNRMNAKEDDPLRPIDFYGISKACADLLAQRFMKKTDYETKVYVIRPCNIYGYDLNNTRLIPNVIRSCLSGKNPKVFSSSVTHKRQWIFVDDFIDALLFIINNLPPGVYNVGTNDVLTTYEVARRIAEKFGKKVEKEEKPFEFVEIEAQSVDWSKIRKAGWLPKHSFDEGINKTIEQYKTYGW